MSARRACPTCGADFRKGALVFVADLAGKLSRATVCTPCKRRAVTIVTVDVAAVAEREYAKKKATRRARAEAAKASLEPQKPAGAS